MKLGPAMTEPGGSARNHANYVTASADYGNVFRTFEDLGYEKYKHGFVDDVLSALGNINLGAASGASEAGMDTGAPPPAAPDTAPADDAAAALPPATAPEYVRENEMAVEASSAPSAPAYSDTNVQTAGVQEADVVKTDGKYIYTINSQNLCITLANDGKPELISKIAQPAEGAQVYFEMYILKDRIIALRQGSSGAAAYDAKEYAGKDRPVGIIYPGRNEHVDTAVDIFDIRDPEHPEKVGTLSQSGYYSDSRMIGDQLYLISNYFDFDWNAIKKDEPRTYVPLFADGSKQITAAPTEIKMLPDRDNMMYVVISGIDTTGSGSFTSKESIFGNSYNVYASMENIYLTTDSSNETTEDKGSYSLYKYSSETTLTRVQIKDGKISIEASAKIPGTILNQFSMDEKDAVLRVAVTENNWFYGVENVSAPVYPTPNIPEEAVAETGDLAPEEAVVDNAPHATLPADGTEIPTFEESKSSALYTLDMALDIIGAVRNLAPDEQIYSARFLGDTAYFVTFRQTDPLFSVDLSDPANPRILGALKIPGFSEYLHPYAGGLLFGLGKDADEITGRTGDLKLSMFDISNPSDVTEKDKLILNGLSGSEASSNHKAILVDARKSLIAFPADEYYMVYGYDSKTGFERLARITLTGGATGDGYYWYEGLRGMFIDDVFYVIAPNSITAFDMNDGFAKLGTVSLGVDATAASRYAAQPGGVFLIE
jgi:uncharacterized secreted protein with C-terminal beta-propeller domain